MLLLLLLLLLSCFSRVRLCDPMDGSRPSSHIPGILQARTLEWVAISFSNAWKWNVKVKSLCRVRLLPTPWTAAYQAPPSMGFPRQEYWSGVPFTVFVRKWKIRAPDCRNQMQELNCYIHGIVYLSNTVSLPCLGSICMAISYDSKMMIATLASWSLRFKSLCSTVGAKSPDLFLLLIVSLPGTSFLLGEQSALIWSHSLHLLKNGLNPPSPNTSPRRGQGWLPRRKVVC